MIKVTNKHFKDKAKAEEYFRMPLDNRAEKGRELGSFSWLQSVSEILRSLMHFVCSLIVRWMTRASSPAGAIKVNCQCLGDFAYSYAKFSLYYFFFIGSALIFLLKALLCAPIIGAESSWDPSFATGESFSVRCQLRWKVMQMMDS